ncbi:MAG: DUF1697 domain-containing protein [Nibricoccus sp.]
MPRYAAFLRGVSPMNAKMPELKKAFEAAGFTDVKTLLSSGNVVFSTPAKSVAEIERKAEAAMEKKLGRTFYTIVRPVDALQKILEADPFARFKLPSEAKRVITFRRAPRKPIPQLPIELSNARILATDGCEVFSAYVSGPEGPVFMTLIEKNFGKDVTTRTWDTVRKCAGA